MWQAEVDGDSECSPYTCMYILENVRHFGASLSEVRQSAYPVTMHADILLTSVGAQHSFELAEALLFVRQ